MLKEQVAAINWGDFAGMIGEVRSGRQPAFPNVVTHGTLFVGVAIITAQDILNSGEIEPGDLKLFLSEVTGSLLGKIEQRSVIRAPYDRPRHGADAWRWG